MRKFLPHGGGHNGMALPPLLPLPSSSINLSRLFTSPLPSPSPSPAYSVAIEESKNSQGYVFPSLPFGDNAFDLPTLLIILALLFLSIVSLFFIINLRIRSRRLQYLQNFNSFWTVRLMLITFATLWALNEVLRLPFFRKKYIYPFMSSMDLNYQAGLCKLHIVLSFGLFEPGFLVTLLFLVSISAQQKNPTRLWAVASVLIVCFPILILQTFFVFLSPLDALLPTFMHVSSVLSTDVYGNKMVLCTYPLFSGVILAAFAIGYSFAFLLSCWRVAAFVINKSIAVRINVLTFTVMISLPVQILCLGMSPLWLPHDPAYCFLTLAMFLAVAGCIAVGEIILVIRPISDALAACGNGDWSQEVRLGRQQVDQDQNR